MAQNGALRVSRTAGLPPGTLVHVGPLRMEKSQITLIEYDAERFQERRLERVEDCFHCKDSAGVSWINVDGIHDVKLVETLGRHFGIHPLTMEDILNTSQRPKFEEFDGYLFLVLKMLYIDSERQQVGAEQVSLILTDHCVLSFQEREGDVFGPVRARMRTGKGQIRHLGADYLAYSLMDAVVDSCFAILENLGDRVEEMEDALVRTPGPEIVRRIHRLKHEALLMRHSVWPLREVLGALARVESALIRPATRPYLRDAYDHTIQVVDTIESLRDMIGSLMDLYLSSLSNRMNEVMKVLTIIATVFIPLTFIAGVYGMNFRHMPELREPWGYPAVLALMLAVALAMLYFFRRKKWI